MATVNVLRAFYDKGARRKRMPGDVFATSNERAREIESKLPQHVSVTYEPQVEVETSAKDYSSLTKAELQALCDERGITYAKNASKAKLIGLLGGE